jgi:phosphoribosylaminoimidazole-succinocarboxamide synthase
MSAIKETHFSFPGQTGFYRGKVRDVYYFDDKIVMVATDRISAFDVILPEPVPLKGAILNTIAFKNLKATEDIVKNWCLDMPDPNVTIGVKAEPLPVEMVIRGYLSGHAWREYKEGKRFICGVPIPGAMKENDKFPKPIITPSTKAIEGHDEDISKEEIIKRGLVEKSDYEKLETITLQLFERGTEIADERGLILVDTKYEFGKFKGEIVLIDEIHTPDSSRYFYKDGYAEKQEKSEPQRQLSKEFVREWLISEGFMGQKGQTVPEMTEELVSTITARYQELFEKFTGGKMEQFKMDDIENRIKENIDKSFKKLNFNLN